jgi:carboxylate-amine ligase
MTSAAEHAFGQGSPLTVGVEEEYMLLDATSFELSSRFDEVAEALAGGPLEGRAHPELMQSTLEVASVVCGTVDELRSDLEAVRRGVTAAIEPLGLRLGGAGAHPFSLSEDQRITTRDRYRWLVEQLQYVARRELVFGMHVHVAVPDPDLAMHVMESLLAELPVLLALSASSPFWRGEATGLASTRTAIFASMPRSGQPPRFSSYDDYLEMVGTMEEAGVIGDYTYLWWDVRPHPRLGTVEIRVMDVQFDLDQTLMLAAYVQASVARAIDEARLGHLPTAYHRQLVSENKWCAARYGLDALLMDLAGDPRTRLPAAELARRSVDRLAPYARELGCGEALAEIERTISWGNGATRMMRAYNANREMTELMRELAHATELRSGEALSAS